VHCVQAMRPKKDIYYDVRYQKVSENNSYTSEETAEISPINVCAPSSLTEFLKNLNDVT